MSDSFSAGQLDMIVMPVVFTESFSIDGSTTNQSMATTTPLEENGGGSSSGGGSSGGSPGAGGGGALKSTTIAITTKSNNSLSFNSTTVDGATSRSVARSDSGSRTTATKSVY